jgi:ABC-type transport system involved in multi-copper enzyme maturation permease subunit
VNWSRVGAVMRKEFAEFQRNRFVVTTACILPVVFLIAPTAQILAIKATTTSTAFDRRVDFSLFFPLLVSVFVPAVLASWSVVGEKDQGTLEPVLTTPLRRAELVAGKALAIFVPALVISYVVYGVFFAITQLFAVAPAAAAVRSAPELRAGLVFIPLLAGWAIWAGLAISTRANDTRVAYQLSALSSLPPAAIAALFSFNVITADLASAVIFAAVLLVIDCAACFGVSRLFDRERLVLGTRSLPDAAAHRAGRAGPDLPADQGPDRGGDRVRRAAGRIRTAVGPPARRRPRRQLPHGEQGLRHAPPRGPAADRPQVGRGGAPRSGQRPARGPGPDR